MSVWHEKVIITAAQAVHDKVWFRHWREGDVELRSSQVIEYIRDVRVEAGCGEDQLPGELISLLAAARLGTDEKRMMSLDKLIIPLNDIIRPPAELTS